MAEQGCVDSELAIFASQGTHKNVDAFMDTYIVPLVKSTPDLVPRFGKVCGEIGRVYTSEQALIAAVASHKETIRVQNNLIESLQRENALMQKLVANAESHNPEVMRTARRETPCRHKGNCFQLIGNGSCAFYHTQQEREAAHSKTEADKAAARARLTRQSHEQHTVQSST